jgi:hypothetical protein
MIGLYEYPETAEHPAFNLTLRVNFVNGAGETSGFRFVGSEGIMNIGNGLTLSKTPREVEPGYTIDTFAARTREQFLKEYAQKYPPEKGAAAAARAQQKLERYVPPRGDNAHLAHHRTFFDSVRTRRPLYEDATVGMRAAGPALATNLSYSQEKALVWDPRTLTVKG